MAEAREQLRRQLAAQGIEATENDLDRAMGLDGQGNKDDAPPQSLLQKLLRCACLPCCESKAVQVEPEPPVEADTAVVAIPEPKPAKGMSLKIHHNLCRVQKDGSAERIRAIYNGVDARHWRRILARGHGGNHHVVKEINRKSDRRKFAMKIIALDQLDNHALQHDLAEHAVVRGLTADLNELKTFIRDTLCTDFAALQHSSVGLAHDLNDVNEALQAVNLESDATRGRLDDAQNLLADRVRATVREIHHFALHRRVFIPLFYGVSEVFLRPPKIPL